MSENPFKAGDVVESSRSDGFQLLECGRQHNVVDVSGRWVYVDVDGTLQRYSHERLKLVSRTSEEWSNGDDVEWGETHRGKYVGPDPYCSKRSVICWKDEFGLQRHDCLATDRLRRPKPARTIEQLLERLGDGWTPNENDLGNRHELKLFCNRGLKDQEDHSFVRESRQACIDAAWELLVKEDGDEADSAE